MKTSQSDYWIERDYINNPLSMTITTWDRAQVIDFVEELHAIFDLIPETLFISIQTIDWFIGMAKD